MTNFQFSGKILCGLCNWKYRGKTERSKKVYLCSKYSKSVECERHQVNQDHLFDLIHHQLEIYGQPTDRVDLLESIILTRKDIQINYTGYAPHHPKRQPGDLWKPVAGKNISPTFSRFDTSKVPFYRRDFKRI